MGSFTHTLCPWQRHAVKARLETGIRPLTVPNFEHQFSTTPQYMYWGGSEFRDNGRTPPIQELSNQIGKGGNLYSPGRLRGVRASSVQANIKTYGGGASYAPWVDEVWQMPSMANSATARTRRTSSSGGHLKTPDQTEPFFSPMLAEHFDVNVFMQQQAHEASKVRI